MRLISSRSLEFILAKSAAIRSWEERVNCASVESEFNSSDRSFAKSTFCVYVARSESAAVHVSSVLRLHGNLIESYPLSKP